MAKLKMLDTILTKENEVKRFWMYFLERLHVLQMWQWFIFSFIFLCFLYQDIRNKKWHTKTRKKKTLGCTYIEAKENESILWNYKNVLERTI